MSHHNHQQSKANPTHPANSAASSMQFSGRCNVCGDTTYSHRAASLACKWGGCNGTVRTR